MRRRAPRHLHLVPPAPIRKQVAAEEVAVPHGDATLFHKVNPRLMVCMEFDSVTEAEFLSVFTHVRPRFTIDLRAAPRFDLGSMNRRLVFSLLEHWATKYIDLSGTLGVSQSRTINLQPVKLVETLMGSVFKMERKPVGPLLFIIDAPQFTDEYVHQLSVALEPLSDAGWEVLRFPEFERVGSAPATRRETIFISHATPEQNDFAKWLSAQLSLAGYRVWFDVEHLLGGEVFWDEIERIIREKAGKVLVAVTSVSQRKPGVLDEVNLAINVERSLAIENFVIPLRVDAIPYEQFRANLARKNIIDFSMNWAAGLSTLLQALQRDGFPRANTDGTSSAAALARHRLANRQEISREPEVVELSWSTILSLPQTIYFHAYDAISPIAIDKSVLRVPFPLLRYLRLTASFASVQEFSSVIGFEAPISSRCELSTEDFLRAGTAELPGIKPRDARNMVTNLLRQAWEKKAVNLGLRPYKIAANTTAWFLPAGLIPNDQINFTDSSGTRRKKKLLGYSGKRGVFWHYALELKPVLTTPRHFSLKSHVVFTHDGIEPISSSAKLHLLRRAFCRSWWNDRWRDLTAAYLVFLAAGEDAISLPVNQTEAVRMSVSMLQAISPISIREPQSVDILDSDDYLEIDDEEAAFLDEEMAAMEHLAAEPSDE